MPDRKPLNHFDELVERMSDKLVDVADRFPEEAAPFGAVKLTPEEQLERYLAMRDNPQEWMNLLNEHGIDSVCKYALEMEGKLDAQSYDSSRLEANESGSNPLGGIPQ